MNTKTIYDGRKDTYAIKTKYVEELVTIDIKKYQNNSNTALTLTSLLGEPIMKVTLNVSDKYPPCYVVIKDYSENEGILSQLIEKELVYSTTRFTKEFDSIYLLSPFLVADQNVNNCFEHIISSYPITVIAQAVEKSKTAYLANKSPKELNRFKTFQSEMMKRISD